MAPPKKAEQTPAVIEDDNERVDDDKESRITDHEGDEEEDDDREQESLEEEGSKGKSRLEKEFESLCDDEASDKEEDPARADSPRSSAATASPSELAIMKAIGDGLAKLLAKSKGDDKAYKSSQWPSLSKRLEKIDMSSMDKSLIRQTALDEVDRNSLSLFEKEIWYFSDDQKDQSFGGFIRALLSWLWVALLEGAAFGDVYSHVYHCISAAGYKSPSTGRMAGTLVAAQYDAQMRKEAGCSMSMSWSMDDKNYVSVRKACSGLARFDANRLILLIGKASADSHQKNNYGQGNRQTFRGKKRSYSDDVEEVWKKINGKWIKVSGGKASGSYEDKHKSKKTKAGQDSKKDKASDGKSSDVNSSA